MTLRDYQVAGINDLRAALRAKHKRPLLMLPTGAGKTKVAAEVINMALAKGSRVIFTVPALSLIDQTVKAFWNEGIREVGVIQANHPMTDSSKPVQVCSVQTLQRRPIPEADLVIVDEAHLMFQFVTDWMGREEWAGVPFIGLSATPWSKGLGRLYDKLVVVTTTEQLIEQGYLSPFRVFAPSHPDLTGVKTKATAYGRDYDEEGLAKVMKALVADVVKTWLEKGEDRPTLCFAVNRDHAQKLHEQFTAAGVPAAYMDANTPVLDREQIRRQFHDGSVKVVCNVGVLTTGVDWDVRCLILARPTKSIMLYVQIVGRALRTAPGKDYALILDHSDTTLRLGFVTDIHRGLNDGTMAEAGDGGGSEAEAPKPRECPSCGVLRTTYGPCPNCGHVAERKRKEVEVLDGELVEMSKAQRKHNAEDWSEKVSFMRQLLAYQRTKGMAPGWVGHKYRARYGVWPNDPRVKYAEPAASVTPEVASWIRSQNIRFAKGRAKERAA